MMLSREFLNWKQAQWKAKSIAGKRLQKQKKERVENQKTEKP